MAEKDASDDNARGRTPPKQVKARVLVRTQIDGEWHEPNTIVTAPAAIIKGLEAQGSVDSNEESVSYAESQAAG